MWLYSLSLCLCLSALGALADNYANHTLIKIFPENESDLDLVLSLGEGEDPALDLWSQPNRRLDPILGNVAPHRRAEVASALKAHGVKYEVIYNDLQDLVETQRKSNLLSSYLLRDKFDLEKYHSLQEITDFLKTLEKKYPEKVNIRTIGTKTSEGRDVEVLVLGTDDAPDGQVVFECGVHAREWVSPASCLWIADRLLGPDSDLLKRFQFHIIPVLNPDGYLYSFEVKRLWRKNRSNTGFDPMGLCRGVDVNRNFDAEFTNNGKTHCDGSYAGLSAFSEPESAGLRDYLLKMQKRKPVVAYFAIHNFGQLWMYPYGHSSEKAPSNKDQLDKMAKAAVDKIKATSGEVYQYGTISEVIYKANGCSVDWVYDNIAKVAFAIELRPTTKLGFLMDDKGIRPASEELWNGAKEVLRLI